MIRPISRNVLAHKPKPFPKGLIYNPRNSENYYLMSTKTGKFVGKMIARPIKNDKFCYADKEETDLIFYIHSLEIFPKYREKGWGSYFLDFAKKESFNKNCNGRSELIAYNYEESPQAFYYKNGYFTKDKEINKILEEYVKRGWKSFYWQATLMYLPEKEKTITKNPPKNKILKAIKKIFKF